MFSSRTTFQGLALALSFCPLRLVALTLNEPSLTSPQNGELVISWIPDSGDPSNLDIDLLCGSNTRFHNFVRALDLKISIPLPSFSADELHEVTCDLKVSGLSIFITRRFQLLIGSGKATSPTSPTCPAENNERGVFITTTTTTTTTTTAITTDRTNLPCIPQPPQKPLLTSISISTASPESTMSSGSSTSPTVNIISATSIFSSSTSLIPTPTLEPQVPVPEPKNRGAIIGGTVGGIGSLVVIIGLAFGFRKYRKYRRASQSAQFSGIREVKTGVSFTSLLPSLYHVRGSRPSPFSLIQGNPSSSPINKHSTARLSENLNPGGPNVDEASAGSVSQQESRAEMEAALKQREILESNLEERLSHRTSIGNDGGRYTGVEQRLRDGIKQMNRRITELELELAVERRVVGLPPPGYVLPMRDSATRS